MKYRKLGKSGLKVSELSFGSWVTFNKQVDSGLAERMFGTCFDAGLIFLIMPKAMRRANLKLLWVKH